MGNANICSIVQHSLQFGISCFSLQTIAGSLGISLRVAHKKPVWHSLLPLHEQTEWSPDLPRSRLGWGWNEILVLQFPVCFLTPRSPLSHSASYITSLTKGRCGGLGQGLRVDRFHEENLKVLTYSSGNQKADHSKEARNLSPVSLCPWGPG